MSVNKNKDFGKNRKDLFAVEEIRDKLKMLIYRDLQIRFSMKFFRKEYPDEEMDKNIVLAFQVALYLLGEYNENIDYSDDIPLALAFANIKNDVAPTAKEVIERSEEIRELVFRFNNTSISLFTKIYSEDDKVFEIEILKDRKKILDDYFVEYNEYKEPESIKKLQQCVKNYEKEVDKVEALFRKTF